MASIPSNAKRVFKGEIFEVYQWRQRMFDGSAEIFEMLKRPDTVQIIAVAGNKIWVTEEEQPHHARGLGMLGGMVDEGEKPLAAARRELLEESGLASDDWELWKTYNAFTKIDWNIHYYIARSCRKVAAPKLDIGERIKIRKVGFRKFIELFTSEKYPGGEFTATLLRLQLDPKRLEQFRRKLLS